MHITALLVSVRNVDEAKQIAGRNVQIIDVKEPSRGPLGLADSKDLVSIAQFFEQKTLKLATLTSCQYQAISVALGEATQFLDRYRDGFFDPWAIQFQYAKFGLARIGTHRGWWRQWEKCLKLLPAHFQKVAVAYADYETCNCPTPERVLEIGAELDCQAFLIDTHNKMGDNLFDYCDTARLRSLCNRARELGVKTVLAGSIDVGCLKEAVSCQPDLIGVRGAICDRNRISSFCESKFINLRKVLDSLQKSRPIDGYAENINTGTSIESNG